MAWDEFEFNSNCTGMAFTYTLFVNGSSTLPGFIDYESTSRSIWVQTTDISHMGFYDVMVRGSIYDGTFQSFSFVLEIEFGEAPVDPVDPGDDGNGTTKTSSSIPNFNRAINSGAPFFVKSISAFSVYAG